MRKFADTYTYSELQIVQQAIAKLPWGHNIVLLDNIKADDERQWYANQTVKHGWSRNVLMHQVESTFSHEMIVFELMP